MMLYVAGPMSGLPEFNYPAFMEAERRLLERGYDVSNPARVDEVHAKEIVQEYCVWCRTEKPHPWKWYMLRTFDMIANGVEGIATLPNWQKSRGARLEVDFASALELPIASVDLFIDRYVKIQRGDWDR